MISDELFQKLKEQWIVIGDTKPTFEELWERLPIEIHIEETGKDYYLWMEKYKHYNQIGYYLECMIALAKDNSNRPEATLSDLAAEMLIELKNRGMM